MEGVVVEVVVVVTAIVDALGTSMFSPSWTSTGVTRCSAGTFLFLWSTAAKNCQVDANTSALLASLVPHKSLETPEMVSLGTVFTWVLGSSI